MKPKNWLFEKINKRDDSLAWLSENKREKKQTMWEPGFSQLEWKFTNQQRKEARMIYVVIDQSWKHQ